jgi:hypothetical protein
VNLASIMILKAQVRELIIKFIDLIPRPFVSFYCVFQCVFSHLFLYSTISFSSIQFASHNFISFNFIPQLIAIAITLIQNLIIIVILRII